MIYIIYVTASLFNSNVSFNTLKFVEIRINEFDEIRLTNYNLNFKNIPIFLNLLIKFVRTLFLFLFIDNINYYHKNVSLPHKINMYNNKYKQ